MTGVLGDDLAHAESTLANALRELEKRVTLGRRDKDSSELVEHCAEMVEIVEDLVGQAGHSTEVDDARARASVLAARLARLQHDFGRVRLQ